jgi:hypothetical protein
VRVVHWTSFIEASRKAILFELIAILPFAQLLNISNFVYELKLITEAYLTRACCFIGTPAGTEKFNCWIFVLEKKR